MSAIRIDSRALRAVAPLLLLGLMVATAAPAQEAGLRSSLFEETDQLLAQANEVRARILAPENFDKAMEYYREAEENLEKGRDLEGIRNKVRAAGQYLKKAIEATKLARVTLADALAARDDADAAEAEEFAQESWTEAEKKFREAARELEDGDVKDAQEKAGEAREIYRDAELTAIKTNYLQEAWQLLEEARELDVDDRAPSTLEQAAALANEAERKLNESRYDTDEARALAHRARQEAQHAIYLSKLIRRIEDDDDDTMTMEQALLAAEESLRRIAAQMDIAASFETGLGEATRKIIERVRAYRDSIESLSGRISERTETITTLQARIDELESQLGGIAEERTELVERLEAQARVRQKFVTVERIFAPEEARVLREGDDIIIRLYGLSFPVGESTIEPKYFGMLTKVQQAINLFPEATVTVEGHTDSFGGDDANLKLSNERADAVRQYLLANMRIDPGRIDATGYGEEQPIASNETPEGRAKNRRTDVVIHPRIGG